MAAVLGTSPAVEQLTLAVDLDPLGELGSQGRECLQLLLLVYIFVHAV